MRSSAKDSEVTRRKPLTDLTELQQKIVEDVREHGPSTAVEIARRVGVHDGKFLVAAAVRAAAAWARGWRWLDDGSVATPFQGGFLHTDPPSPIRWRFIDDEDAERMFGGRR